MLTAQQLQTLEADILADPAFAAIPHNTDGAFAIAAAYSLPASPDFWVWRTNVTRADIYHSTSPDGTTWNWTTYKNQSVTEQNAWVQMFMGDIANFSLVNLRAGVAAIFTGTAPQTAQRDHCLSVGRRKASRIEKLLSSGTGSAVSPATMGFEGALSYPDVQEAMGW
jgi:hypothetical protein